MQQRDGNGREKYVAPKAPSDDTDTRGIRSPIVTGAISLGIYIAMYLAVLAVAGVVRVLTPPDPAAVAPDSATAPASTATASNHTFDADDSPSRHDSASSTDGNRIQYTE